MPGMAPRSCVFGGLINPKKGGHLRDRNDALRFWPVTAQTIDLESISRDRALICAEAMPCFRASTPIRLDTSGQINRPLSALHHFTL